MSTTLYYASDIHGSDRLWRKFVNAAKFYDAQILVMGGDITGKAVIPVVARGSGYIAREISGERLLSPDELPDVERQIRDRGFYPARLSQHELTQAQEHPEVASALFSEVMERELEAWLDLAKQRLAGTAARLYLMLGNDDEPGLKQVIADSGVAIDPEDQIVNLGEGIEMASCGWANITPWHSPRELPEDQLQVRLEASINQLKDPEHSVWNVHVPPLNTPIDRAPQLDDDRKPVVRGGSIAYRSVGSSAVRSLMERYQPLLGLHGHIHEARGTARIGKTICINPGSQYADGVLDGALIALDRKVGLKHYQLVSG